MGRPSGRMPIRARGPAAFPAVFDVIADVVSAVERDGVWPASSGRAMPLVQNQNNLRADSEKSDTAPSPLLARTERSIAGAVLSGKAIDVRFRPKADVGCPGNQSGDAVTFSSSW